PAADHATRVPLDQLAQRDRHLFFHVARLVHVAGDAEHLGAGVVLAPEAGEPFGAAAHDRRYHGDALHVVDRGRAAPQTDVGGEGGLEPWHALPSFQAFDQRHLLAADVGAGAAVNVDV